MKTYGIAMLRFNRRPVFNGNSMGIVANENPAKGKFLGIGAELADFEF